MSYKQFQAFPPDSESFIFRSKLSPLIDELDLGNYKKLKTVRICILALSRTSRFLVHNLLELSSLIVETNAFITSNEVDKECRIYDCPKLTTLSFQRGSFRRYSLLELRNLPLLTSFDLDTSFRRGKVLHLRGL